MRLNSIITGSFYQFLSRGISTCLSREISNLESTITNFYYLHWPFWNRIHFCIENCVGGSKKLVVWIFKNWWFWIQWNWRLKLAPILFCFSFVLGEIALCPSQWIALPLRARWWLPWRALATPRHPRWPFYGEIVTHLPFLLHFTVSSKSSFLIFLGLRPVEWSCTPEHTFLGNL